MRRARTIQGRLTILACKENVLVIEYGDIEYANGVFDPPTIIYGETRRASAWELSSLPSPSLNNNTAFVVAGKVVGGSSAVNGMFFDRGSRFDYDAWDRLQDDDDDEETGGIRPSWKWDALFPFFKKSVTFTPPPSDVTNRFNYTWNISAFANTTPIHASFPPFQFGDHFIPRRGWQEMGIRTKQECADGDKEGLCWIPISQHPVTARRSHAGLAHYADVVENRPNYHLLVKHQVTRVVYPDGNSTKGPPAVEVRSLADGTLSNITVKSDVILSAGTFGSAAILQRSGIGPSSLLHSLNIPLVIDLPGVGSNLQDHSGPTISWNCKYKSKSIGKKIQPAGKRTELTHFSRHNTTYLHSSNAIRYAQCNLRSGGQGWLRRGPCPGPLHDRHVQQRDMDFSTKYNVRMGACDQPHSGTSRSGALE